MQKGHTRRKTYQFSKGDLLQKSPVTQPCPQPHHYSTPITFRKLNDCCSKDNECENNLQTEVLLLYNNLALKTIVMEFILKSTSVNIFLEYKTNKIM